VSFRGATGLAAPEIRNLNQRRGACSAAATREPWSISVSPQFSIWLALQWGQRHRV